MIQYHRLNRLVLLYLQLGGIVKPNDGFCHLDPNDNTYREPLNQDYPSLGQISHLAKKNDINLIFAVTDKVAPSYREFQKVISGSSVGILSSDSENIVNLIRDSYKVQYTHLFSFECTRRVNIYYLFRNSIEYLHFRWDDRYSRRFGEGALLHSLQGDFGSRK